MVLGAFDILVLNDKYANSCRVVRGWQFLVEKFNNCLLDGLKLLILNGLWLNRKV